ncbi:MAG: hypothetical protein AB8B72_04730 [Crocinitomicaceae bacterium]
MKKKIYFKIKSVLVTTLLFLIISCGKQTDYQVDFAANVSHIQNNTLIKATIEADVNVEVRGLLYSLDTVLQIDSYSNYYDPQYSSFGKLIDQSNSETHTYQLNQLKGGLTYYYRLFSVHNGLVKYGPVQSFLVPCLGLGCGPAGGQIIYIDSNGEGIEVAENFLTQSASWGCSNVLVGGTGIEIGTGQANTSLIVNTCGTGNLADFCQNYTQNGFSDYYMPSIDELKLIHSAVYKNLQNPYFWSETIYLSSTEASNNSCSAYSFSDYELTVEKTNLSKYRTIPVRSF